MSKLLNSTVKQITEHLEISTRIHKKGFSYPNHWHDYFEFEIVLSGEYEHIVGQKKRIARRGSAWIMSHLDYHSFLCTADAEILNISFTGHNISQDIIDILSSSTGGFLCEFDTQSTNAILKNTERAAREIKEHPLLWQTNVRQIVESVLIETIRLGATAPKPTSEKPPRILQSVVAHIQKNYSEDLSLLALSRKFNISPGYLGLAFSNSLGLSASAYVTRVRMKRACALLENSELSTKEIAYACGFKSIEYFHYAFKKYMQITPAAYRAEMNESKKRDSVIYQMPMS